MLILFYLVFYDSNLKVCLLLNHTLVISECSLLFVDDLLEFMLPFHRIILKSVRNSFQENDPSIEKIIHVDGLSLDSLSLTTPSLDALESTLDEITCEIMKKMKKQTLNFTLLLISCFQGDAVSESLELYSYFCHYFNINKNVMIPSSWKYLYGNEISLHDKIY
jgi:hypothetical protein